MGKTHRKGRQLIRKAVRPSDPFGYFLVDASSCLSHAALTSSCADTLTKSVWNGIRHFAVTRATFLTTVHRDRKGRHRKAAEKLLPSRL